MRDMRLQKVFRATLTRDFKRLKKGQTVRLEPYKNDTKVHVKSDTEFEFYFDTLSKAEVDQLVTDVEYLRTDTWVTVK